MPNRRGSEQLGLVGEAEKGNVPGFRLGGGVAAVGNGCLLCPLLRLAVGQGLARGDLRGVARFTTDTTHGSRPWLTHHTRQMCRKK